MEQRQIRPFEISIGVRHLVFLLSISSVSTMFPHKWILNQVIEMIVQSEITFIALLLVTIKKEGLRLPSIVAVFNEFILQFYKYDKQLSLKYISGTTIDNIFMFLQLAFVVAQISTMYLNPVFYPIPTTGSLQVGYTVQQIDDIKFAVFYPTEDAYDPNRDIPYLSDVNKFLDLLAFFTYRYPREFKVDHIPAPLLKISLGPLLQGQKMDVIFNANLAKLDNKYPIMMYSHGFNSHMNFQATFCKEFASKGVIVFVPMHRDEDFIQKIKTYPTPLSEFKEVMNESVMKRKSDIQKMITYVLDPSKKVLGYFPNGSQLKSSFVAKQQIIMCGHSYGGLTSMAASLDDSRIYSTIVLDPAMSLFDEDERYFKLLNTPQKKPFLILCSQNFHKRFPMFSQREHIQTFLKAQNDNKHAVLGAELQGYGHGNFMDLAFFIPYEISQLRQDILKVQQVSTYYLILNKLVEYFICESSSNNADFKSISMDKVVGLFQDLTKNILEIKKDFLYKFEE